MNINIINLYLLISWYWVSEFFLNKNIFSTRAVVSLKFYMDSIPIKSFCIEENIRFLAKPSSRKLYLLLINSWDKILLISTFRVQRVQVGILSISYWSILKYIGTAEYKNSWQLIICPDITVQNGVFSVNLQIVTIYIFNIQPVQVL